MTDFQYQDRIALSGGEYLIKMHLASQTAVISKMYRTAAVNMTAAEYAKSYNASAAFLREFAEQCKTQRLPLAQWSDSYVAAYREHFSDLNDAALQLPAQQHPLHTIIAKAASVVVASYPQRLSEKPLLCTFMPLLTYERSVDSHASEALKRIAASHGRTRLYRAFVQAHNDRCRLVHDELELVREALVKHLTCRQAVPIQAIPEHCHYETSRHKDARKADWELHNALHRYLTLWSDAVLTNNMFKMVRTLLIDAPQPAASPEPTKVLEVSQAIPCVELAPVVVPVEPVILTAAPDVVKQVPVPIAGTLLPSVAQKRLRTDVMTSVEGSAVKIARRGTTAPAAKTALPVNFVITPEQLNKV